MMTKIGYEIQRKEEERKKERRGRVGREEWPQCSVVASLGDGGMECLFSFIVECINF